MLSRNLTFDCSWDLTTVLDGDLQKPRRAHNKVLLSFFNELVSVSKKQGHQLAIDADELMCVRWHMPMCVNGLFELTIRTDELPYLNGFYVVVSMLAFEQFQSIFEKITCQNLKRTQVSAPVRFDIKKAGEVVDRLVTQLPLKFNCDVNRNKAIVNDLVQTQSQYIHYLSMMLDIQPYNPVMLLYLKAQFLGA